MARGRFLNRSIRHDKRLNGVSIEAEYLFLKCVPHLDRDGITSYDTLWADVMPLRPGMMERIPALVQELIDAGLVILYDTDEGAALYFTGFGKNQTGLLYKREAPSRFPPPPGYTHGVDGIEPIATKSRSTRDKVATTSDKTLPKVKVKDQVEVEVEVQETTTTTTTTLPDILHAWTVNEMDGKPVGAIKKSLSQLIDKYGAQTVLRAIEIACERGDDKRNVAYVRGILNKGVDCPRASPNGTGQYHGYRVVPDEGDDDGQ